MTIEIIITNNKTDKEPAGASKAHRLAGSSCSNRIVQRGVCLNPDQYNEVYRSLKEIDQLINESL